MTHHRWNSIKHTETTKLRRVSYNSPQEFTRNTQWCAVIDIKKIMNYPDASQAIPEIEAMNTENQMTKEPEIARINRVELVRANNRRIISELTTSRKTPQVQIPASPSSQATSSTYDIETKNGAPKEHETKRISRVELVRANICVL
jgi:hypothetical protein